MTKPDWEVLDWFGCYRRGWGKELTPEAYQHPAKASYGLAERIYAFLFERGYLAEGMTVLDPFAGIGGFAYHALKHGLNFIGCELEPKFVALGQANIDLWNSRYAGRFARWGTAQIFQGDSRHLAEVLAGAGFGGAVSSPPFGDITGEHSSRGYVNPEKVAADFERKYKDGTFKGHAASKEAILRSLEKAKEQDYGSAPGQLGNLHLDGKELESIIVTCQENTTSIIPVNAEEKSCGKQSDVYTATTRKFPPVALSPKPTNSKSRGRSRAKKHINGKAEIEVTEDSHNLNTKNSVNNSVDFAKSAAQTNDLQSITKNLPMKPEESGTIQDATLNYCATPVTENIIFENTNEMHSDDLLENKGDFDSILTSPPFLQTSGGTNVTSESGPLADASLIARHAAGNAAAQGYGESEANLGNMREGQVDMEITSPPYAGSLETQGGIDPQKSEHTSGPNSQVNRDDTRYGQTPGQLARLPEDAVDGVATPDTFWAASKTILEQTYRLLRAHVPGQPGGVAVFVLKRYIRDGQIVDFSDNWRRLAESVGFKTIIWIRAWLTTDDGTQLAMDGNHKRYTKKRVSFFRRLHEKKRPDLAINWEDVIIMAKPLPAPEART